MKYRKRISERGAIGVFLIVVVLLVIALLVLHDLSLSHFQEISCGSCHEMKDIVKKWRDSETAKNHNDCSGCHFDKGIKGRWEMHKAAVTELITHFERDPNEPIKPAPEPLFIEHKKEPAYWSNVPNRRCFQCKDAKNHNETDQQPIHGTLIKDIAKQPCKDCHNHEMREGQKFYHKALPEKTKVALR